MILSYNEFIICCLIRATSLQWRHNGHDGISNHQLHDCLLNRFFFQVQIRENIKALRHWPLWGEFTGDRWIPLHKGPVTQKVFLFDDIIMLPLQMTGSIKPGLRTAVHQYGYPSSFSPKVAELHSQWSVKRSNNVFCLHHCWYLCNSVVKLEQQKFQEIWKSIINL